MIAFFAAAMVFVFSPENSMGALEKLRWNHRAVVLFAPSPEDRVLAGQLAVLKKAEPELRERDVVVLVCAGEAEHAVMRNHFGIRPGAFVAILVGKDGGEKWRTGGAFPVSEITDRIDAMPMGRDEAKQRERTGK